MSEEKLDLVGLVEHVDTAAREAAAVEKTAQLRVMRVDEKEYYVDFTGNLRNIEAELELRARELDARKAKVSQDQQVVLQPLTTKTLQSVADFYEAEESPVFVEVTEDTVNLALEQRRLNGQFNTLLFAAAEPCGFRFGEWLEPDAFVTGLLSWFAHEGDVDKLLALFKAGVKATAIREVSDDGVSQQVRNEDSITGLATWEDVGNPRLMLYPYRTFREIEQPPSMCTFRVRSRQTVADGKVIEAKLIVADGGAWKVSAVKRIKQYLKDHGVTCPIIG